MSEQKARLQEALLNLNQTLSGLTFSSPVTHVYNPLVYAADTANQYLERYLVGPSGRTLLLGMNPGPWGMAQTGVPFGEVEAVRDWLKIEGAVGTPATPHPKRPVEGFECRRSEVSGRRLWGFFRERFPTAEEFGKRFVVYNYCPLIFLEESGRNRTPDKLSRAEREALFEACDSCLLDVIESLEVTDAVGIGRFALGRLEKVRPRSRSLKTFSSILHPSPANPAANRGWAESVAPVLGL